MARDQMALGLIQGMAEQLLQDVSQIGASGSDAAVAAISAQVELDPARRAAFIEELQQAVQTLARKFGASENAWETETFKLMLACYKQPQGM